MNLNHCLLVLIIILFKIGNRYFTCAPGHGSFARAEKLNFGISFMQALKSKYINETAQEGRFFIFWIYIYNFRDVFFINYYFILYFNVLI